MISMSRGRFRWLLDAPQGFHQIGVDEQSQEKLAFAGPYTRKYTYKVMPFGPVNGSVTFVIFIYDCKADWDDLAVERGIDVSNGTNTVIIIDDMHDIAKDWDTALRYLEAMLDVCLRCRLSLNLRKCHLFTPRFDLSAMTSQKMAITPPLPNLTYFDVDPILSLYVTLQASLDFASSMHATFRGWRFGSRIAVHSLQVTTKPLSSRNLGQLSAKMNVNL
jgi:hypothetical protein